MMLALLLLLDEIPRADDERTRGSLSFVQRLSVPDGELSGGGYDDVFDLGYGVGLEFDYLLPATADWSFGPYAGFDVERFTGQEETIDGLRLEADDLTILNILFGVKSVSRLDPLLSLEGRLGVGFSHFFSTDAEIAGGPSIEFFEASTEIAAETGFRAVFEPGSAIRFSLGAGVRLRGSAEEGEDAPLNPGTMIDYVLELAIGVRF